MNSYNTKNTLVYSHLNYRPSTFSTLDWVVCKFLLHSSAKLQSAHITINSLTKLVLSNSFSTKLIR